MDDKKEQMLQEIENLLAYGDTPPEISPALLAYLSADDLKSILEKLKERTSKLKEEDKAWLRRFKKH